MIGILTHLGEELVALELDSIPRKGDLVDYNNVTYEVSYVMWRFPLLVSKYVEVVLS